MTHWNLVAILNNTITEGNTMDTTHTPTDQLPAFVLARENHVRLDPVTGWWYCIRCDAHTHQDWLFRPDTWSGIRFNVDMPNMGAPTRSDWQWYQNPKTQYWYRTRPDDFYLYCRFGPGSRARGYQVQLQDFIRDYFQHRPARLALDVGANMGITAMEYAHLFDSVVAFEPIADVFKQLEMVVERNGLHNVDIKQLAIGNHVGQVKMKYTPNNSFASAVNVNGTEHCPMNTIDSHRFRDVDFIKIDVEGLETAVIQGAWQTIQSYRPMIQFEYKKNLARKYGYDIDQQVCDRLISIGYTIIDKRKQSYLDSAQLDLFAIPPINKGGTQQ